MKWVTTDVLCSQDLFECRILSLPTTIWLFSGVCNCSRAILLQRSTSNPVLVSLSHKCCLQTAVNLSSFKPEIIAQVQTSALSPCIVLLSFWVFFCNNFSLEKTERETGTMGDLSPMLTYWWLAFLTVLKLAVWYLYCSLFLTGHWFNQDMSLLLGVISHFAFLKARASLTRT